MFLYEKLDALREFGGIKSAPEYIGKNLNAKFELRAYQVRAFENFVTHYENKNSPRPLQVLFHMATGSGKTLIMAGLIIYLYKQGYRNFLFFVNLTNIIDKTRENFLNGESAKYLFAQEITIDGEKVKINAVENFQDTDANAINLCFETTQGLHAKMFLPRENDMTLNDFDEKAIVFISDEAHHLNADTKQTAAGKITWEQTVQYIFGKNAKNILLEFTATCDIGNAAIRSAYEDKIIFDYPLLNFYHDGFSKDIISLRSDFRLTDRALQAVVLSQYRLKIFQDNRLSIKPVILFKAAKIADSAEFMAEFLGVIKNLDGERLGELFKICSNEVMRRAREYFERKKISFEMLAAELRGDFSAEHCLSVNDEKDAAQNQILLNTLESAENPYRAIFEVKKLDEGWDVLNLFDIVRLYETRQSGGKKISATTISEAQLIGRGSRYCPFKINPEDEKFRRKYDSDVNCELRICETLYYHCQDDPRYISELKNALKEIGLDTDKICKCEYKLKESFKASDLYRRGVVFVNSRKIKSRPVQTELSAAIRDRIYKFDVAQNFSAFSNLITDEESGDRKIKTAAVRLTLKEIAEKNYALVHKALLKFPNYKFAALKNIFPNLKSAREFITNEKFLGGVKVDIYCETENPGAEILYDAAFYVLGKIAAEIEKPEIEYEGTTDFQPRGVSSVFTDKILNCSADKNSIDLSQAEWSAYVENYGTAEEKAFLEYFSGRVDELQKIYSKIFLVRNERQLHICSFEEGARFEPDYILFLQKRDGGKLEQLQIFIEPKGKFLLQLDAWKEKFLLQLKEKAAAEILDSAKYLIWGFHFYNQDAPKNFDEDFESLVSAF